MPQLSGGSDIFAAQDAISVEFTANVAVGDIASRNTKAT